MANLTKSAAKTHSEALVSIVLLWLDGWCVDDDIYEESVWDEAERAIENYLNDNDLENQDAPEILVQIADVFSGWAIDDDLPIKVVRAANKAVAAELLR